MTERLTQFKNQVKSYVDSSFDYLNFKEFLSPQEEELRKTLRAFLEAEIAPTINDYYEKAEFPYALVKKLKALNIFKYFLPKPYGEEVSNVCKGVLIAELARIDLGFGTFVLLCWGLVMITLLKLGSKEQIAEYIPKLRDLEIIGGWGLTEEKIGSDASNIETSVKKVEGGYILNGNKRWIGNGNKDILLVFAKNQENGKVETFILDMKTKGVTTQVLDRKLAMRIVENCQIRFNNVFIPEANKLPKATDFSKGANVVLKHSRIFLPWLISGTCLGVYDHAIKQSSERKQFGVPVSSFQLSQEKLFRIMSNTQAILLCAWRITKMGEKEEASIGQISMFKAFCSERGREVTKLGRELCGGNGLLLDNWVMKYHCDMEVLYTYEGSYDINALICGRELTGIAAFKAPQKKQ